MLKNQYKKVKKSFSYLIKKCSSFLSKHSNRHIWAILNNYQKLSFFPLYEFLSSLQKSAKPNALSP